MVRKQYPAEEIISHLRTVDIEMGKSIGIADACRRLGITEQTYYWWITALLHQEGWRVNHQRVEQIWRHEGLKVPKKQPKWVRLWLTDGACIRKRSEYPNHVRSHDFVMERTQDGRPLKLLTVVDEYTREYLAIAVRRRLTSRDVQEVLSALFLIRGCPTHIRSDNGPEFIARALRAWYGVLTITPLFMEPGSPWKSGHVESFNGKLWDKLLNGELFYTLHEAQIFVERWRCHDNTHRPYSALGVSATNPRNTHSHTGQFIGVTELAWWPNIWGQISDPLEEKGSSRIADWCASNEPPEHTNTPHNADSRLTIAAQRHAEAPARLLPIITQVNEHHPYSPNSDRRDENQFSKMPGQSVEDR